MNLLKMEDNIVVLITSKNDQSTNNVIKWLIFFKQKFVRINIEDSVSITEIVISNEKIDFAIKTEFELLFLSQIKSIWYWKGNFNLGKDFFDIRDDFPFKNQILRSLSRDRKKIVEFLNNSFLKIKCLGNIAKVDINKLGVLSYATEIGLKIPNTLITTKKKSLLDFQKINKSIITKAISSAPLFTSVDIGSIHGYTTIIDENIVDNLNDDFPLSLFQSCVNKRYEIRTFYLAGSFYSMAIFSQMDNRTSVDFRDYNFEKPNRTVPHKLPDEVEDKLKLLLERYSLNTASLDLALSTDNEYVLFEINPVGQYGMTSYPCNYNLDKKIAEFLYE